MLSALISLYRFQPSPPSSISDTILNLFLGELGGGLLFWVDLISVQPELNVEVVFPFIIFAVHGFEESYEFGLVDMASIDDLGIFARHYDWNLLNPDTLLERQEASST